MLKHISFIKSSINTIIIEYLVLINYLKKQVTTYFTSSIY